MIEYIMIAVIALIVGFTFGTMFGLHIERVEWNKLIESGKIRKPNISRKGWW